MKVQSPLIRAFLVCCPQRPTLHPMGAQEVRTSHRPAGTWSWPSPPSSACTSRGQPRHNDCQQHLWILFDIADGWIWYSLSESGSGKNNQLHFVWDFFFFFLKSMSCKYYDVLFYFFNWFYFLCHFLPFWLTDRLVNHCLPFPIISKGPEASNELLSCIFSPSGQSWENPIHFCTWLKKNNNCANSPKLSWQCCTVCIMGCWRKKDI